MTLGEILIAAIESQSCTGDIVPLRKNDPPPPPPQPRDPAPSQPWPDAAVSDACVADFDQRLSVLERIGHLERRVADLEHQLFTQH
jgi:hypothetical protein